MLQYFLGGAVNSLDSAVGVPSGGTVPSEQTCPVGTCSFRDVSLSSSNPGRFIDMETELFQPV